MKDWRDESQFYKVNGSCRVCGSTYMIGAEPRFGYTVCAQHRYVAPVDIPPKVQDGNNSNH